jgi:hypothetical protein
MMKARADSIQNSYCTNLFIQRLEEIKATGSEENLSVISNDIEKICGRSGDVRALPRARRHVDATGRQGSLLWSEEDKQEREKEAREARGRDKKTSTRISGTLVSTSMLSI